MPGSSQTFSNEFRQIYFLHFLKPQWSFPSGLNSKKRKYWFIHWLSAKQATIYCLKQRWHRSMMPYGVAGPLIMYTPLGWNQYLTAHSLYPNFSHSALLLLNKSPTFYYLWVFVLVMNHLSVAYAHIQAQILEYLNHIQLTSLLRTHESESS